MIPPAQIIAPDVECWYVARVRGRTEEDFRDRMNAAGVTVKLVMRKILRFVPRADRPGSVRTYEQIVPAFPGYLFLHADFEGVDKAYETPVQRYRPYSIRPVRHADTFLKQLVAVEEKLAKEATEVTKRLINGKKYVVRSDCPIKHLRGLTMVVEVQTGKAFMRLDEVGTSIRYDISPAYLEPA